MTGRTATVHRSLLLFAILAANPVVTYLLVDRIGVALIGVLASIAALQASYRRFGMTLPTAYLVNVVALWGVFAHAELIVRVRFADYVMEDLYHIRGGYYINRPNVTTRLSDKEYTADYLTNKDGFRIGYSQQVSVSYDQIDWLFLGDSYTQGAQVQFEDLYTTLLYRRFPNRIVANAGISGWGIVEESTYFREEAVRYHPKTVFLQVSNFNDFMKVAPRSAGLSDHLMQRSLFIRLLLQDLKYQNPVRLPLGRWAEPFYPDDEANKRFNIFYKPTDPAKERDLREYARHFRMLAEAVKRDGGNLVVILLPTKEQVRFSYLEEVVTSFNLDPRQLDMERPNVFMRALADSLGVQLIDVLEEFTASPEEPYFEYDEHLSPAGHRLLADIIARRVASSEPRQPPTMLSREYAGDRYPSYSPDGGLLAFQAFADGNMELFVADTGFAAPHRVTYNDIAESHPTIGFPGDRLAFTEGDPVAGDTEVVVSDLLGRSRRAITGGDDEFGAIPSYSADGRQLAYAGWSRDARTGEYTTPQIYVANLASGAKQMLTHGETESWRPVFSPDGGSIAFISKVGSQFDLFVCEISSGAIRRLSDTPYDEWDPRFSPDGELLVFAAEAEGNWDLFTLAVDTGKRSQLTFTRGDEWDPAFSPDGKTIVYAGEYGVFRGIYRMTAPR